MSTAGRETIAAVGAATVLAALPTPIRFGNWEMRHREFAVVRVTSETGVSGFAFGLTRDGPVASMVRRTVAPQYIGEPFADPEPLFYKGQWSNLAILSSGVGLRALSLVDLATWDLAAKRAGVNIPTFLGGSRHPVPVAAIIGYPPTIGPEAVAKQVSELYAKGWRRFKQPIAATPELTLERLRAARSVAGDAWLGVDANWVFKTLDAAVTFCRTLDGINLGWVEDVFPPGNAHMLADLRQRVDVPIAMGDEQGGAYHPDALLEARAVDVARIDATTMGGLTRFRVLTKQIEASSTKFATHMFAHVHSQILAGLGYEMVPVEWGVQWTGVDQFADSLIQPTVHDGLMDPLPDRPGFGPLLNPGWLAQQTADDPDKILGEV